jgi:hypothetical protein
MPRFARRESKMPMRVNARSVYDNHRVTLIPTSDKGAAFDLDQTHTALSHFVAVLAKA